MIQHAQVDIGGASAGWPVDDPWANDDNPWGVVNEPQAGDGHADRMQLDEAVQIVDAAQVNHPAHLHAADLMWNLSILKKACLASIVCPTRQWHQVKACYAQLRNATIRSCYDVRYDVSTMNPSTDHVWCTLHACWQVCCTLRRQPFTFGMVVHQLI